MEPLDPLISQLAERHRQALIWFRDRAGTIQRWPSPIVGAGERTFLATKAKGIYKPEWSTYALSVRQTLKTPYQDREPVTRPDGTWIYSYFQENESPDARDDEFTNRGLLNCWRDRVPVGVMRQLTGRPRPTYVILGLALVAGWEGGYFSLEGFSPDGKSIGRGPLGQVELILSSQASAAARDFDPASVKDGREHALGQIVRRRGQPGFRDALLTAYGGRCAITGCDAAEALEAAHITPYRGADTNHLPNGLLLRADVHTLFDLGLIAIDEGRMTVLVSPALMGTVYSELTGRQIRLPANNSARPSTAALRAHRDWAAL